MAYGGMERMTVQREMMQTVEQLRRTLKLRDKTILELQREIRLLKEQLGTPAPAPRPRGRPRKVAA